MAADSVFSQLYEMVQVIGRGSFGEVVKVRRRSDGKVLVCKVLRYGAMKEKERQLVVSEVNILRELRHANIVRYYDRFIDKKVSKLYIVMEFCEGGDLGKHIRKNKRDKSYFEEGRIWRAMAQLLQAFEVCHQHREGGELRPILHRDIKPCNIFLDSTGNIKVGDFGLAKELDAENQFATTNVGTPYYMSPELINEKRYNDKSDVWSIGCLIYELAALRPPFEALNVMQLGKKITAGRFGRIPSRYSDELQQIIEMMLTRNPNKRPSVSQLMTHPRVAKILRHHNEHVSRPKTAGSEDAQAASEQAQRLRAREQAIEARERALEKREQALDVREQDLRFRERAQEKREKDFDERRRRQSAATSCTASSASSISSASPPPVSPTTQQGRVATPASATPLIRPPPSAAVAPRQTSRAESSSSSSSKRQNGDSGRRVDTSGGKRQSSDSSSASKRASLERGGSQQPHSSAASSGGESAGASGTSSGGASKRMLRAQSVDEILQQARTASAKSSARRAERARIDAHTYKRDVENISPPGTVRPRTGEARTLTRPDKAAAATPVSSWKPRAILQPSGASNEAAWARREARHDHRARTAPRVATGAYKIYR